MTPEDRPHFAKAMNRLFDIYGDELTDNVLDAWAGVLAGYDLRDIRFAMNAHATDPAYGHRRPLPSDIIKHITETLPAQRAQQRNARIRAARERIDPLERELFDLRHRLEFDQIPVEDRDRARARINGLSMQIGAMTREAGINDRPRLLHAVGGLRTIAEALPTLEHGNADPHDAA